MGYASRPASGRATVMAEQTANEQMSSQERLDKFLEILERYRDQIVAVMPIDVGFDKFRSVIIMAARREPVLLECYGTSLINACLYAAHDGLLPDGRDAAIVWTWNKREQRKEASYRPMVRGLIKQALRTGEVLRITAEIVYRNEPFKRIGGSTPSIEHEQLADGDERGDPIGVYAVAKLKNGETLHEYMTIQEIEEVRKVAQQDHVWSNNWGEMARKTVIRRLQKKLPGQPDLPDLEARTMFPEYQTAPVPSLPRPSREAFSAIGRGVSAGVPLDIDRTPEPATNPARSADDSVKQAGVAQTAKKDEPARMSQPETVNWASMDWDAWSGSLLKEFGDATDVGMINAAFLREREAFDHAPAGISDPVKEFMNERLVMLTAASAQSRAGAATEGQNDPDGVKS